ncbi:MAG: EAL domain-containing protein [Pseudomonadota bacterium]
MNDNILAASVVARSGDADGQVASALHFARTHFEMDVAYLSEFRGNAAVYHYIEAPHVQMPVRPGGTLPLSETYCQDVLAGRLPELIRDTREEPLALAKAMTHALPVGANISVPVVLGSGRVFGMFGCLRSDPDPTLTDRDVSTLRAVAGVAADRLVPALETRAAQRDIERTIDLALRNGAITTAFQPIFRTGQAKPAGFEALARFAVAPSRPPDQWFADAARAGRSEELELAAIAVALAGLDQLPVDAYLSVNAGPQTILSGGLGPALADHVPERLVLEITEHAQVTDYAALRHALEPLRTRGVRIAVDDAGAGFASLSHILQLSPEIIKLDRALTVSIEADPARRALVSALVHFARDIRADLVAEGIETAQELDCLSSLGVGMFQGYHLGAPLTVEAVD